jgi:hypothetical protein
VFSLGHAQRARNPRPETAYKEVVDARTRLVALAAAVAVGLLLRVSWRTFRGSPSTPVARAEIPPPAQSFTIGAPATFWEREGFAQMIAPVRPPSTDDGRAHIVVFIKVPDHMRIQTRLTDDGRALLRYPAGTRADRVEYLSPADRDAVPDASWQVADVRGTTIENADPRPGHFHVARPRSQLAGGDLWGVRWPTEDARAQAVATEALGAMVLAGEVLAPNDPAGRRRSAEHLRGINDCAGCHLLARPARHFVDDPALVNRGTDDSGFFHVSTVLGDEAPLETYRPRDQNRDDPFLTYRCGETVLPRSKPAAGDETSTTHVAHVRCPSGDRRLPVARLDLRAALSAHDAHAEGVCRSRRYLYERLDELGQRHFAGAMALCEPGGAPAGGSASPAPAAP